MIKLLFFALNVFFAVNDYHLGNLGWFGFNCGAAAWFLRGLLADIDKEANERSPS